METNIHEHSIHKKNVLKSKSKSDVKKKFTHLGRCIKRARKEMDLGWTQRQLGLALGLKSGQFISNIERGHCALSIELMHKMTKILNIKENILVQAYLEDEKERLMKELSTFH